MPLPPGPVRVSEPDVLTSEESHHLGELAVAPEERRRLHRKVRLIERPQRRELGVSELVDVLGRLEVLQAVVPEVANRRIDEVPRRLGQQHLVSVSGRRDACSPVHVETHVPFVREDRLAGMDPHANPDRAHREGGLSDPRRLDRVTRSSEGEEERVTLRVDFDASVRRRQTREGSGGARRARRRRRRPVREGGGSSPRCR